MRLQSLLSEQEWDSILSKHDSFNLGKCCPAVENFRELIRAIHKVDSFSLMSARRFIYEYYMVNESHWLGPSEPLTKLYNEAEQYIKSYLNENAGYL